MMIWRGSGGWYEGGVVVDDMEGEWWMRGSGGRYGGVVRWKGESIILYVTAKDPLYFFNITQHLAWWHPVQTTPTHISASVVLKLLHALCDDVSHSHWLQPPTIATPSLGCSHSLQPLPHWVAVTHCSHSHIGLQSLTAATPTLGCSHSLQPLPHWVAVTHCSHSHIGLQSLTTATPPLGCSHSLPHWVPVFTLHVDTATCQTVPNSFIL